MPLLMPSVKVLQALPKWLLVLGLLASCSTTNSNAPVNLKAGFPVGSVLSLTGNANVYGQDQRIGLELAQAAGLPVCGSSISAMFGFFLCEGPVRNFEEAKTADTTSFAKLHRAMLERGVYLAPSAFEAGFTSLAHSEADIDATIDAFRESFASIC